MRALVVVLLTAVPVSLGAQQPKGAAGLEAARQGGSVIVCRHGITGSQDENEATLRYEDPSTQRRLSERGERQAEAIGRAFRVLGISVSEIIASPMERARRTAELAFGAERVRLDSAWHTRGVVYSGWKHDHRLAALTTPLSRGNRVIVSHVGTMTFEVPAASNRLEEGDCVVVRPRGEGRYDVVGVVPWRAWLEAAHLDVKLPQS